MQNNSVSARVLRVEIEPPARNEGAVACEMQGGSTEQFANGSARAQFDAGYWFEVLQHAQAEGYNSVTIVARGAVENEISKVVYGCAKLGLTTSLNVSPDAVERLPRASAELVQYWVLRLNGPGERAASTARMTALLNALRALSPLRAKVTLAIHLDQTNLDDLPWAAWLAAEQAVSALTVETAQVYSRATPRYVQSQLDVSHRVWAMLVLARACQRYPAVRYEIDLSDVNLVRREPERLLAAPRTSDASRLLADMVSPLVIDSSGNVSPLLASLSPKMALGHLHDASLAELSRSWKASTGPSFQRFCRQVHADVCENTALPFFNWAEYLQLQSRRIDAIVPRMSSPVAPRSTSALNPKDDPGDAGNAPPQNAGGQGAASFSPLRPRPSRLPELPWGPPRRAHTSGLAQRPLSA